MYMIEFPLSIILGVVLFLISGYSCSPLLTISKSDFESNSIDSESNDRDSNSWLPHFDPANDLDLTTPELITKYGYNAEVHYVTTDDGYILQLHRIAGSPKSPPRKGKKVCILQHGLLDSSATWVLTGPNHALGYLLADNDYDVWLGNSRGNLYSTNHTKFKPFGSSSDRQRYWAFSWHQMGIFDLPAMIDYILEKTGEPNLHYVGHSQGTTSFFVMSSERPEYNSKIKLMQALGPVAFMSHVESPPIRMMAPFASYIKRMSSWMGIYDITTGNKFTKMIGERLCRDHAYSQIVCDNIMFLIMGYSPDELNTTLLPLILSHTPAGSSVDQVLHYGQEINSGHFRQLDYGSAKNFIHYKRPTPPDYKLHNINVPIALYYASYDWLACVKDVERLHSSLPNVVYSLLVPHKNFNHVDFLWGIDAPKLVYEPLLNIMNTNEDNNLANLIM